MRILVVHQRRRRCHHSTIRHRRVRIRRSPDPYKRIDQIVTINWRTYYDMLVCHESLSSRLSLPVRCHLSFSLSLSLAVVSGVPALPMTLARGSSLTGRLILSAHVANIDIAMSRVTCALRGRTSVLIVTHGHINTSRYGSVRIHTAMMMILYQREGVIDLTIRRPSPSVLTIDVAALAVVVIIALLHVRSDRSEE